MGSRTFPLNDSRCANCVSSKIIESHVGTLVTGWRCVTTCTGHAVARITNFHVPQFGLHIFATRAHCVNCCKDACVCASACMHKLRHLPPACTPLHSSAFREFASLWEAPSASALYRGILPPAGPQASGALRATRSRTGHHHSAIPKLHEPFERALGTPPHTTRLLNANSLAMPHKVWCLVP